MTIQEEVGAAASVAYQLPSSFTPSYDDVSRLDGIIKELDIVAGLEENQRLCQQYDAVKQPAERPISDVYLDPAKQAYVSTQSRRVLQAKQRSGNGDSLEGACERIQALCNEIVFATRIPFATKFDFYNGCSRRLRKFNAVFEKMMATIAAGKGLHELRGTTERSEVNAWAVSEASKSEKLQKIDETIRLVDTVSKLLGNEIEALSGMEIQAMSSNSDPEKHLSDVLAMVMNPTSKFECSDVVLTKIQNLPMKDVKKVLNDSFGQAVVNDVLRMYGMNDSFIIDYEDFHALIVGITANLTYQDVADIVKSKKGIAYEKLSAAFGAKLPDLASDGDVIAEDLLFDVAMLLRNVDLGDACVNKEKPYAVQLGGDLSSIISCNLVTEYDFVRSNFPDSKVASLKQFGYIEHLARDHCYSRFDSKDYQFRAGVMFPQYDENGNKVCRQAVSLFNNDYIFTLGVCPIPSVSSEQKKVQVVFRGTADIGSVHRDLSFTEKKFTNLWEGPGGKSFERNQGDIIFSVENFLRNVGLDEITFEISGHSLGATDAQRFAKVWAEHAVMKNAGDEAYSKVSGVNLVTFNGPATETDYRDSFYSSVAALPGKQFNVTYFTTHRDEVHGFGTYYVGQLDKGVAKPDNLNRRWIQFNFMGDITEQDSVRELLSDGSLPATTNAGFRKYNAHSRSYFKENDKCVKGKCNPVEVRYYCLDDDDDLAFIDNKNGFAQIPNAVFDQLLTTGWSYSKYLTTLDDK